MWHVGMHVLMLAHAVHAWYQSAGVVKHVLSLRVHVLLVLLLHVVLVPLLLVLLVQAVLLVLLLQVVLLLLLMLLLLLLLLVLLLLMMETMLLGSLCGPGYPCHVLLLHALHALLRGWLWRSVLQLCVL